MRTTGYQKIAGQIRRRGNYRDRGLLVTEGWVNCPRTSDRDVNVEACYGCSFLKEIVLDDAGSSWIQCRSRERLSAEALNPPV